LTFIIFFSKIAQLKNNMNLKIQRNLTSTLMKGLMILVFGMIGEVSWGQVTYTLQTGNFTTNSLTANTNSNYFAGSYNNSSSEVGFYANGSGVGYTGDPGVASFQTFTTNGIGNGTARPLKVGDQFTITCYVGNNTSFFNSSNSGISFNGNTTYSAFANYSTNQRAKFQINKSGNWFPFANGAGSGFATPAQDVTFTIKLTSANTANLTLNTSNGATSYDMLLGNSPASSGDNITSFAIWNQTSGLGNDMYWKNGSLTATGSVEIGNGNGTSTISGVISNGLAANSTSTVSSNVLTKTGSGTITLTAQNTYTGLTTVAAGTLKLYRIEGNTLPVTNNVTLNGGTLQISSDQTLNNLTISSGGLTIDDGVTLTINGTLTYSGGTMSYGSSTLGNLVISSSGQLIVSSGTFSTNGRVTLKSNATGTASIGNSAGTISGNVNVERYVSSAGRRWRFLSSPVQSKTIADWRDQFCITGPGTTTNSTIGDLNSNGWHQTYNNTINSTAAATTSVRKYDEVNSTSLNLNLGWSDVTTATALTAGRGFRTFIRGPVADKANQLGAGANSYTQAAVTLSLTGAINAGNFSAPSLTYNQTGWNLLGNPYPCAFDWNAFHDAGRSGNSGTDYTYIDANVYIYDGTSNSYKSYSATANSGTLTNGIIPSGAGFFVQATASSPTLTFKETYKTTSAPIALHKTMMSDEFTLKFIKDETESDEIILKMIDGATLNKDGYDINKLGNENLNLSAYGTDSNLLTLSAIPFVIEETRIKLNIEATEVGTYKFDFTNMDQFDASVSVSLLDKYTNTTTDVRKNTKYTFDMGAEINQWGNNRFELILNLDKTNVDEFALLNQTQMLVNPNPASDILNISLSNINFKNSNIVVYNVSGMEVSKSTMNGASAQLNIESLSNGVYFVKVSNENGFSKTVKFIK